MRNNCAPRNCKVIDAKFICINILFFAFNAIHLVFNYYLTLCIHLQAINTLSPE